MPYSAAVVERFNGLRLLPEQGEAPGSVSMLNADLSRDRTQVGTRGGLSTLGTGTATYHRIAAFRDGTAELVIFRNTGAAVNLSRISLSGTVTSVGTFGGATTIATSTAMTPGYFP